MAAEDHRFGDALLDPRLLLALIILVLNDHWAKAVHPGLITGKISDFAGMIVLPVLLATCVAALPNVQSRFRRNQIQLGAAVVSGLFLAAIKTSSHAATAVTTILETLTGIDHHIVVDPTDLLGLTALPIAITILRAPTPIRLNAERVRRHATRLLFALTLAACMATSYDDPAEYPRNEDLELGEDGAVRAHPSTRISVEDPESPGSWIRIQDDTGWLESTDDGRSWEWREAPADFERTVTPQETPVCLVETPTTCFRVVDLRVEMSTDGGDEWSVEHDWDRSHWIVQLMGTPDIFRVPKELVRTESDAIIASAGTEAPIRRDPLTGEWSYSQGDFNQLEPRFVVMILITQLSLLLAAAHLSRSNIGRGFLLFAVFVISLASLTSLTDPYALAWSVFATLFMPFAGLAVVGIFFSALNEDRRSMQLDAATVVGLCLVSIALLLAFDGGWISAATTRRMLWITTCFAVAAAVAVSLRPGGPRQGESPSEETTDDKLATELRARLGNS